MKNLNVFSEVVIKNIPLEPSIKMSDKSRFLGVLHQPDKNNTVSETEDTNQIDLSSLNSINIRHSKQHLQTIILDFYHKRQIHLEIGNGNEKDSYYKL